jgi:molybdate transport system permease protein
MELSDPKLLAALAVTAQVALWATLLAALPALAAGWLLVRRRLPLPSVVETLLSLPLVLPPTAIGYALLALFARDGPLGERALGFDPGVLLTRRGAVLASAVVAFPLAARTARAAFESVDPRLERMARALGLSRARTFATVTLPLAGRGLAAALVLACGRALGEFGATVIVAGNIPGRTQTLSIAIFDEIQLGHGRGALTLVGVACVLAFAALWTVERLTRPRSVA